MISTAFPYNKQQRRVLSRDVTCVEAGMSDPIVFLHGNPISSYLPILGGGAVLGLL